VSRCLDELCEKAVVSWKVLLKINGLAITKRYGGARIVMPGIGLLRWSRSGLSTAVWFKNDGLRNLGA
jgi:uncharacterized membrane-anchored protein